MYYFQSLFQKKFCWGVSISENEVKTQWMVKATLNYRNFISKIKKGEVGPSYVPRRCVRKMDGALVKCRVYYEIRK